MRTSIHNIRILDQCDCCDFGWNSDLFDGEYVCLKKCGEILYPERGGTADCPYFEEDHTDGD